MSEQNVKETATVDYLKIILVISVFFSFICAYLPVWKRLLFAWYNYDDYSHGFFIIPICCYIIWRKKEKIVRLNSYPSNWGFLIVIFSLNLYVISNFAEIATLASFSMILLIAGVVAYLSGFILLKELIFPLFLLLFMIPVPSQIYSELTIPLQLFVSKLSAFIAFKLGIPIYREGNVLHLPDRTLQVVQACSGLRSIISLLTLSAVLGYLTLKSNLLRSILFVSGVPAAIIVNVVRVLVLIIAFHYFQYDLTINSVHTAFGIFIFFLAILLVGLVKGVLSNWDRLR